MQKITLGSQLVVVIVTAVSASTQLVVVVTFIRSKATDTPLLRTQVGPAYTY